MILVSTLLFSACESIQYYGQAVSGQLYILTHRQTLAKLLSDPAVSPHLQEQLERISAIRTFAASQYEAGDLVFGRRGKRSGQHGQPPM